MTQRESATARVGRGSTAQEHRDAVHDVTMLQEGRDLLVQRLERVVVALALTLDAEAAAEERLAQIEERAGVHRISNRAAGEWAILAQRYRDLLQAIDSINDELQPDTPRSCP